MEKGEGVSQRERLELMSAAMVPAGLALMGPLAETAGRLGWLAPMAALPVGLWLCRCWGRLGAKSLGEGLEGAFGRWPGRVLTAGYLLWGLFLLAASGRRYIEGVGALFGEMPRWMLLAAALGLGLWLSREPGTAFARGGRIFFLLLAVTLGAILVLALPGVEWRCLWPPAGRDWQGLLYGGGACLSLAGYGIYGMCLPAGEGEGTRGWPWAVWGCCGLAAAALVTIGAFGPALTAQLSQPFLALLEGVKVPGAFQRGEAALAAALVFGDLMLFGLLIRGCGNLWRRLVPDEMGRAWWLLAAGAFLLAGSGWGEVGEADILFWGNLAGGVLIPSLAFFTKAREKR